MNSTSRDDLIIRLQKVIDNYENNGNKNWHYKEIVKKIALLRAGSKFETVNVTEELIAECGKGIARIQKAFGRYYPWKKVDK